MLQSYASRLADLGPGYASEAVCQSMTSLKLNSVQITETLNGDFSELETQTIFVGLDENEARRLLADFVPARIAGSLAQCIPASEIKDGCLLSALETIAQSYSLSLRRRLFGWLVDKVTVVFDTDGVELIWSRRYRLPSSRRRIGRHFKAA